MSIQLKINKKIDLKAPKFLCDDNPLGTHLNQYDMLSHLNKFGFSGIIGRPGSGKTSLLISFLTATGKSRIFKKVFNNILLVMPTSSRNSLKKNIFSNLPEEKTYEDLSVSSITDIYNHLEEYSADNENTLLILDDVGASLKNPEIGKILRKIIYNRRHLKVHIITLLQSFLSVPKEIRKLYDNLFLFKPPKTEFITLMDEVFEQKKHLCNDILSFVFDKEHQYLMMNVPTQRLYKGFDELIFSNV
jgi:KaiC/GvpD/RAD55 family RecA-like ATPase